MAGTGSGSTLPITVYQVKGTPHALPQQKRLLEDESETFKTGTPVVVSSGYLIASPTLSSALKIAGISSEAAHNLTTQGVPQTLTYGSVQNQPSAVNIPLGAPLSDGCCGVFIADDNTIFVADSDSTAIAAADVGAIYGITADSNGQWFIDKTITAAASGAIAEVVALVDEIGTAYGRVAFRITNAGQQFGI